MEGNEGSPEPLGLVFKISSLSKIKYTIAINPTGSGIQRICLSTFLMDLRVIHWYKPRMAKMPKVAIDNTNIMFVIKSHCIIFLL